MSAGPLYVVLLLPSSNHCLRGERVLLDAGIANKLIPVPRQISSDCGVCLRVLRPDRATAQAALLAAGLKVEGIHEIQVSQI